MNILYQTHLTEQSIKNITQKFFSRYCDPLSRTITVDKAQELIQHIYESTGQEVVHSHEDGVEFLEVFASNPSIGITYSDLEKVFTRMLSGEGGGRAEEGFPENFALTYTQRHMFEQEANAASSRVGRSAVSAQLRHGRTIFKRFDRDNDGVLTNVEAKALISELIGDSALNDAELAQIIGDLDYDRDGKISAFDFDLHCLKTIE